MELVKTNGLVLKSFPYSEKRKIARLFTSDLGVVSCMVRNSSFFSELSILDLVLRKNSRSEIYYVSEVKYGYVYKFLSDNHVDLSKNCTFMFINELLIKCIQDGVESQELYNYIKDSLIQLDRCEQISPEFHIIFMLHLAKLLGFELSLKENDLPSHDTGIVMQEPAAVYDIPDNIMVRHTPSHDYYIPEKYIRFMVEGLNKGVSERLNDCSSRVTRNNLTDYVLKYFRYHSLEVGELKSIKVLKELLD